MPKALHTPQPMAAPASEAPAAYPSLDPNTALLQTQLDTATQELTALKAELTALKSQQNQTVEALNQTLRSTQRTLALKEALFALNPVGDFDAIATQLLAAAADKWQVQAASSPTQHTTFSIQTASGTQNLQDWLRAELQQRGLLRKSQAPLQNGAVQALQTDKSTVNRLPALRAAEEHLKKLQATLSPKQ